MGPEALRCGPDITYYGNSPVTTSWSVNLNSSSKSCNIVQHLNPLSELCPFFSLTIKKIGKAGLISIGLADSHLPLHVHPGHWSASMAYFSDCKTVSSRIPDPSPRAANLKPAKQGDIIGIGIVHVGVAKSVVMVFLNEIPLCTRYIFEGDHSNYLPTVGLENGPISIDISWQSQLRSYPSLNMTNVTLWMKPPWVEVDPRRLSFTMLESNESCVLQGPKPFTKAEDYIEVECCNPHEQSHYPIIGVIASDIAFPRPLSPFYYSHIMFNLRKEESLKAIQGKRLGCGVKKLPYQRDSSKCQESLLDEQMETVIVYFTLNGNIAFRQVCLEPLGGWYPFLCLHSEDPGVRLVRQPRTPAQVKYILDHEGMQEEVFKCMGADDIRPFSEDYLHHSTSEGVEHKTDGIYTYLRVAPDTLGIQKAFNHIPLSVNQSTFIVRIRTLGEESRLCVGVCSSMDPPSGMGERVDSALYHSDDGSIINNGRAECHSHGHRYGEGDEITVLGQYFSTSVSVLCFLKNNKPIGTCFCEQAEGALLRPILSMESNGGEIRIDVLWNTHLAPGDSPQVSPTDLDHWCMPEGIKAVDSTLDVVFLPRLENRKASDGFLYIQCPVPLQSGFNHFEIELLEDCTRARPPPAICLCNASPRGLHQGSNYHRDFLKFQPAYEDFKLKRGDRVGFGIFHPETSTPIRDEQLVFVFLTVNLQMAVVRVCMQPPGGFFPAVVVPPTAEVVKFCFEAVNVNMEDAPLTNDQINYLLERARQDLEKESVDKPRNKEELDISLNYTLADLERLASTEGHTQHVPSTTRTDPLEPKIANTPASRTCDIL